MRLDYPKSQYDTGLFSKMALGVGEITGDLLKDSLKKKNKLQRG